MSAIATPARTGKEATMINGTRPVEIDGESYLWTEIAPDLYELAFMDKRPIGRVVRTPAQGRNKELWRATDSPTSTTMPSMVMRGLITRYWRKQATDPNPAPPRQMPMVAPMPEPQPPPGWLTAKEAMQAYGLGRHALLARIDRKEIESCLVRGMGHAGRVYYIAPPPATATNGNGAHEEIAPAPVAPPPVAVQEEPDTDIVPPGWLQGRESAAVAYGCSERSIRRRVENGQIVPKRFGKNWFYPPPATVSSAPEPAPVAELSTAAPEPTPAPAVVEPPAPPSVDVGLLGQLERLYAARVEDARTIGRLTMQIEMLEHALATVEQRLAECQQPKPRKWWQP